jgi:GNAT superfamily N-acetyltransferase
MTAAPDLVCRPVTAKDGALITRLFGPKGACAGCWCMYWRLEKGGKTWAANQGEPNRRAFMKLLKDGDAQGALALAYDVPVGWCAFGPREAFRRLQRSRVLDYRPAPETWSINCFFIQTGWRKRGVASALLKTAIETAFGHGARVLEAYPTPQRAGEKLAAAFAWTGTRALFEKAGFAPSPQNARVWIRKRPRRRRPT